MSAEQSSDVAASPSGTSSIKRQATPTPGDSGGPGGLTYRERVVRFYEAYAPENLSKVDTALERYRGKEELLIDDLKLKYGKPEPPLTSSPSDAAAAPGVGVGLPPLPATASGSPRRLESTSALLPSPSLHHQNTFGDTEVSEGDDDVSIPDPYASLRSKVTQDVGFADPALKHLWEDAWLGKIPFGNLKRQWGDTVIHSGLGWKLTNSALAVQRWQRRFFVLVPHFLYYFDSDDAKAPCKGAVYLERAKIKETEIKERRSIVITPRVHKKPLELVAEGDFSNFTINFDPKKAQDVWMELLTNVAKITPQESSAAAGGSYASPMVLKSAASTLASQKSMRRVASSASPAGAITQRQPSSVLHSPGGGGGGSSLLGVGSSSFGFAGEGPLALPPVVNSASMFTSEQFVSPRGAAASQPPHSEEQHVIQQQPRAAASIGDSFQQHDQSHHGHGPASSSPPADDAMLRRALQNSAANLASATTPEEHKKLMLQQQQLHQMLLAAQQQQNEMLYRTQLQQEVAKAKQTLHVDEADIKRRIARVAAERSPQQLADSLLSFVMDHVTDLNALWKLMSALDDLPRQPQPQPQQQQQPPGGGANGDIASQIEALQQQQRRLEAVSRLSSQSPVVPQHQQQHRSPPAASQAHAAASGVPPSPPPQQLTFDEVSHRLAAEHQQRRNDDAARQRQRIQDNYEAANRYCDDHAAQAPQLPPSYHGDKMYSPSPVARSSRVQYSGGVGVGATSDDYAWQDRIARMKQRKRAVEGILNDLPS